MKKVIISLIMLLCLLTIGCSKANKIAESSDTTELTKLFTEYSESESPAAAEAILSYFLEDPKGFISILSETSNQEQILMLLGTSIETANNNNDSRYQDKIDGLDIEKLSEKELKTLNFIKANINAVY